MATPQKLGREDGGFFIVNIYKMSCKFTINE